MSVNTFPPRRHTPIDVLILMLTMTQTGSIVSGDGAPVTRVGEEMHYRVRRSEDRKCTQPALIGCTLPAGLLLMRREL
jgi:hypothetical protein